MAEATDSPAPILVAAIGTARGAAALAAATALCPVTHDREERDRLRPNASAPLLVDLVSPRRGPTLLASSVARSLEEALREAIPDGRRAAARGRLCNLPLSAEDASLDAIAELAHAGIAVGPVVVHLPAVLWIPALEHPALGAGAGLLRADLPRDRSLAALAVADLRERGLPAKIAGRPLGRLAARRALAGIPVEGAAGRRLRRLAGPLLRMAPAAPAALHSALGVPEAPAGQRGQALSLVMAAIAVLCFVALILAAIGGAATARGRAQRGADLAAISAARSMRDDFDRLFVPARLPDGAANPRHLDKSRYIARAVAAARQAARRNGLSPHRLRVRFPDAASYAPVRVRVRVTGMVAPASLPAGAGSHHPHPPIRVMARATAEAAVPGGFTAMPARASGGGYSGPLAYRQGKPMRPDVAAAFDHMAAAARAAGVTLVVNSAFRSDAEQARLFAANPDPRWVAPPGHSLHRCATELDLGSSAAYGWLAANAGRFGFLKRYSWEAWHFGYTRGPAPCAAAANRAGGRRPGDGRGSSRALPSFVPARYRAPILRAAFRWNVSAALISAQLMAESNFNPYAGSSAGAQGIAQFIPSTAASYGLRNPYNAPAAIDAEAHLMADLLRRFRSVPLAIAAYNAGPGAVAGCHCIPPYAETRAYVARILGLLGGAGDLLAPPLEVRLVA